MDDLYLDIILDRYKHPTHKGWIEEVPEGHTLEVRRAHNVSCGDRFEVALLIRGGLVVDAKWRGEGCAISTASTDLVTEWMIGKTLEEIQQLSEERVLEMIGLETIISAREKCLFLPLNLS